MNDMNERHLFKTPFLLFEWSIHRHSMTEEQHNNNIILRERVTMIHKGYAEDRRLRHGQNDMCEAKVMLKERSCISGMRMLSNVVGPLGSSPVNDVSSTRPTSTEIHLVPG